MQSPEPTPINDLDRDRIHAELQRILASEELANAPALSRFLSYLVQRRVEGSTTPPKEYTIGVDVFGRGASFDPRTDTIVRVEARRLRKRLSRYYEGQGRTDPIRMTIPKGHYQVGIAMADDVAETGDPSRSALKLPASGAHHEAATNAGATAIRRPGRRLGYWAMGIVAVAVVLVLIGQFVLPRVKTARKVVASPDVPAKSIAVLPFTNLSSDKNNVYFVQGIQDLILTKLADIGDLKVIARTSTLHYGSNPDNLTRVGKALGVATLLEGSVQKINDNVLVNVQLIDAKTDAHIWAQSYQRTLTNVFGVEGEVAAKVATALNAKLSPQATAQIASNLSDNPTANDAYLHAEYFTHRGNINYAAAQLKQALPLYRQAIAMVPDFALARAQLSFAESTLAWFGTSGENVKQLNAEALAQAEQALKLAPNLPEAQLAMGYCDYYGKGDYGAALTAFATVLKLRPNDTRALAAQGFVLRRQGRFDVAIASFKQALVRDPRNSDLAAELGITYQAASRWPRAEAAYQHALALDPANVTAKLSLSNTLLLASGNISAALAAAAGNEPLLRAMRVDLLMYQRKYQAALTLLDGIPDIPENFDYLNGPKALQQANLYHLLGKTAKARDLYAKALPQAQALMPGTDAVPLDEAFVWSNIADADLGLGEIEQALTALAKSQALLERVHDQVDGPELTVLNAALYAEAARPDLAVPLLARALATPGIGFYYSPVLLWLDPSWDPIRHTPQFQALLKKYAKDKPAVIPAVPGTMSLAQ